jgi:hypothetical protein
MDKSRRVLALVLGVGFILLGIAETVLPSAAVLADGPFGLGRCAWAAH